MNRNYRVYELTGSGTLRQVGSGTTLAASPEIAARHLTGRPGKFVVTDLNYTEIYRVDVTLTAERH
jgi:hypothetical protein